MRLVLSVGKAFLSHRVAGEITVQCLAGRLELNVDGTRQLLRAGQLMFLEAGVQHGLVGVEDAIALLTIVLCKP